MRVRSQMDCKRPSPVFRLTHFCLRDTVHAMLGIGPADLPWWGWLMCGFVATGVGFYIRVFNETSKKDGGCGSIIVPVFLYFADLVCLGIGVIRFIKWVWEGARVSSITGGSGVTVQVLG